MFHNKQVPSQQPKISYAGVCRPVSSVSSQERINQSLKFLPLSIHQNSVRDDIKEQLARATEHFGYVPFHIKNQLENYRKKYDAQNSCAYLTAAICSEIMKKKQVCIDLFFVHL